MPTLDEAEYERWTRAADDEIEAARLLAAGGVTNGAVLQQAEQQGDEP